MLSVILPVKDEPDLTPFLLELHETLEAVPDDYEVIVVEGDREKLHAPYPAMPHQRTVKTYGDSLERSILNGFSHAKGDRILVMDADGSHPVGKVSLMHRLLDDYEMVVGSRYVDGAKYEAGRIRGLFSRMGRDDARAAGSSLTDPMSGFFAIRRGVLSRCVFKPILWKVGLEIELRAKPRLTEIPIGFAERRRGLSKNSFMNALRLHLQLFEEELS